MLIPVCAVKTNQIALSAITINLLKAIVNNPEMHIDSNNIFLTGHSLGVNGVLYMGEQYPELFTALMPISAGYNYTRSIPQIKHTPI